jgi:prophage maintenance system killer protein
MKKIAVENLDNTKSNSGLLIYSGANRNIEVKLEDETIWLSQKEVAEIFETERSVISRHIRNIFNSGELEEKSNVQKIHIASSDRPVANYSLDVILSVGYRVNSKKATRFRIWATRNLREYLTKGIVVNQQRLKENEKQLIEARKMLLFIGEKAKFEIMKGQERELLDLINEYAKSWKILEDFDANTILVKTSHAQVKFEISYDGALELVGQMRQGLQKLKLNIYMFGKEMGHKLDSVVGTINQTYDGKELYPSVEEKAANLLYLVIKDHPFTDGNKRIGSMMFLYFLENNNFLYRSDGEQKVSNSTLVALALLVATSDPKEKENIIRLIMNIIQG